MRQINAAGLAIIERFEGFSATPYLCPAGMWTIGYGSTRGVTKTAPPITIAEGEALLKRDIARAEAAVLRYIGVDLTDDEFSALVSFTFNLGAGALQRSGLRQKLNRSEYEEAADEFDKWVRAGGRKLAGLVARRQAEKELFLTELEVEVDHVAMVEPTSTGENIWRKAFGF